MSIRFIQPCPTCGRRIQVRAATLGQMIECPHCHARFHAEDSNSQRSGMLDSVGQDASVASERSVFEEPCADSIQSIEGVEADLTDFEVDHAPQSLSGEDLLEKAKQVLAADLKARLDDSVGVSTMGASAKNI